MMVRRRWWRRKSMAKTTRPSRHRESAAGKRAQAKTATATMTGPERSLMAMAETIQQQGFTGWLSRRCLRLSFSQLCLRFSTPIEAPSPLVLGRLSSRLPLVHRLVVASPVVMCLRLVSPFFAQPPHVSILDPPSSISPAGCRVANIRTTSASRRAATSLLAVLSLSTSTSVEVVIVVVSRCAITIVVDLVACRVVAIVDGDTFFRACVCICTLKIW